MKFPWSKPTMKEQMVSEMKNALSSQIITQFSGSFMSGAFSGIAEKGVQTLVTVMGWKKVPLVEADSKEDQEDQDAIYNDFMSRVNGDRNVVHGVPDPIDMKAFSNDTLSEDDREDAHRIIDAINEAMEINRTGTYRTHETMEEENRRIEEETGNTTEKRPINILGLFMNTLTPIITQFMNIAIAMIGMAFACKMIDMIDKIHI